ncbi:MAG: hypothetical protein J5I93_02405 [Pirellulaceae bacterium]|nr:hypothetical protein [Pirellulaceae bacterium]
MSDIVHLAVRYLAYHKLKTAVLIGSIMIIVYVPAGLTVLLEESGRQLTARAEATPLLIGSKGSPLELVLNSLYFESNAPAPLRYVELRRVAQSGLAQPIPLYTRFRTRHSPIVGTSLDYFAYRGLAVGQGRQMALLGECVLGSEAARAAEVSVGGFVLSAAENVFDIAGSYPLRMRVVGILERSGTPDDRVVFVDLKTAWTIEGLAHGHQDLAVPEAAGAVLRREGQTIVANASVQEYNEVTPENLDSFHFHGRQEDFPITAVIAVPRDERSATLLQGRYLSRDELLQIVRPTDVMGDLLRTVLTVRRYVVAAVAIVSLSTLGTMLLVIVLSLQLRRREMETMFKIGGSPLRMAAIVGTEILTVLLAGGGLALLLVLLTRWLSSDAARWLVQL